MAKKTVKPKEKTPKPKAPDAPVPEKKEPFKSIPSETFMGWAKAKRMIPTAKGAMLRLKIHPETLYTEKEFNLFIDKFRTDKI